MFGLMRDDDFADRFAPALRRLGLRGITDRLDEVPHSVMALPIPGPIGDRAHRDDVPAAERLDAEGGHSRHRRDTARCPRPCFRHRASSAFAGNGSATQGWRKDSGREGLFATVVAMLLFVAVVGVAVVGGIIDGFSIWDFGVIAIGALGLLVVAVAWIVAIARR